MQNIFRISILFFICICTSCSKSTCPTFDSESVQKNVRVLKNPFARREHKVKSNKDGDAFVSRRQRRKNKKDGDSFVSRRERRKNKKEGDAFASKDSKNNNKQSDGFTRKEKRRQKHLADKAEGKKPDEKRSFFHFNFHLRSKKEVDREKDPLNGHPKRKRRHRNRKPQMGLWGPHGPK